MISTLKRLAVALTLAFVATWLSAGEALAQFVDDLMGAARDFSPLAGDAYGQFFEACLAGRVVRPRWLAVSTS